MRIEGSQTVPFPRAAVWRILTDVDNIAQAVPGCEQLEAVADNQFHFDLHIPVGPLHGRYRGTAVVSSSTTPQEAWRIDLTAQGTLGEAQGSCRLHLHENGQTTILQYTGDLQVTGELAAITPRLLQANINALIRRSAEGIVHLLQPETAVSAPPPPRTPVSRQTAVAAALLLASALLLLLRVIGKNRD